MTAWKTKRFWKETSVTQTPDGYSVTLDGRQVMTPAKAPLIVPTQAYAQVIAKEWDAQAVAVNPNTMPVTRCANAAIDKVRIQFDEVADMIAAYGGTDLICYRAESPAELVQRQTEGWDPLLHWAKSELGAELATATGVMYVAQPEHGLTALSQRVRALTPFQLAALHDLVSISGSLVLGFAVTEGKLSADEAWTLSRIDETWQAEQWGVDEEAAHHATYKQDAFKTGARIYNMCKP